VATVSVNPSHASLFPQQTQQLTATTLDASGSVLAGRVVTWNSSAPTVAAVSTSGLVTAVASGNATITATSEGQTGLTTVAVTDIPVATVTVAPTQSDLLAAQTQQLTATALDAAGNTLVGRLVTWSSSAPAVATVDQVGLVTAVTGGSATITATSEGHNGTATISVTDGGTVGLSGGTINAAGGAVKLVFPTNAVANGTMVTVSAVGSAPAPFPGQVLTVVSGAAYSFGPEGQPFAKGVPLTIRYDPANLPPNAVESELGLYTWTNGAWTPVSASAVDLVNKTVTAPISHFSIWGVLAPVSATPGYTLIDLGVLPGSTVSAATGVNNNGDVVGSSNLGSGTYGPFLYHAGVMSALSGFDLAEAINDIGQISGFKFSSGAVRYEPGGAVTTFPPGDIGGTGINSAGVIAGGTNPPPGMGLGSQPALLGGAGGTTTLATLPGDTYGLVIDVNDAGVGTGISSHSAPGSSGDRAVLYTGGGAIDLGVGQFAHPVAINNAGQVVGYSNLTSRAFLYSNGVVTFLPVPTLTTSSIARGINNSGTIVGEYSTGLWGRAIAFMNGAMVDLNTLISPSQFVMISAYGINDSGQIVGYGVTSKSDLLAGRPTIQHAFLLTPP